MFTFGPADDSPQSSSMRLEAVMDWINCEFVEQIPGKCSGLPTVRGTRIFPETVLQYFDRGASVEEIIEDFPILAADVVRSLLAFAGGERRQLAS